MNKIQRVYARLTVNLFNAKIFTVPYKNVFIYLGKSRAQGNWPKSVKSGTRNSRKVMHFFTNTFHGDRYMLITCNLNGAEEEIVAKTLKR